MSIAPTEIRRDVSATRDDFVRALRAAFPSALDEAEPRYRARGGACTLEIELENGPRRNIASLSLPTLRVTIRFVAGSDEACATLLAYLDRYLHRGGG